MKISNFVKLNIVYHPSKFQISRLSRSNFMEVSVRPPKTPLCRHYDVISYHCVSKLAYFVDHGIGYQPSKFQCSRISGSNFMKGGWKRSPCQCYNEIKKPSAYRVKGKKGGNNYSRKNGCRETTVSLNVSLK